MAATAPAPKLHALTERLGEVQALDPPAKKVGKTVRNALGPGALKDALSGTWLGHALHPLLTDVVIGSFTSATLLDVVGGKGTAKGAQRLVGIGLAAYVPTAVTGASDWADAEVGDPGARRIGAVHAATNSVAFGLYAASLLARRRGAQGRGAVLGLAGAGVLGVGGYLGAHLSYAQGIGVDQTTFDPGPTDWTDAGVSEGDLAEDQLVAGQAGEVPVLLVRRAGRIHAMHDRCAHRGGPLHGGELVDGCVQCPWHASRFHLEDGGVARGPATVPQPAYDVRVDAGRVLVKLR